ncbi:MAG: hypothetical protein HZC37_17470 [Burkholderiales bacterium]|nr:hypothetical protein [Burkholderiales bacterium]
MNRHRARAAQAPWLGVHAGETALLGALALPGGTRPRVQLMPPAPVPAQSAALRGWRASAARAMRANVVLRGAEYRVLPIEPPPLERGELREAARWQVADALDFPVEDAAIALLHLPAQAGSQRNTCFVVASPQEPVTAWVECCKSAQLPLAAVDIPEMAMRNLSVLAAGDVAHAFLYVGIRSTRLALIWRRELCSFRQLDIPAAQLVGSSETEPSPLMERLALEIQRTADAFSRQFSGVDLETLWLASVLEPAQLADQLGLQIAQRVQVYDVAQHVEVSGGAVLDLPQGRDYLLAIGGALRQESP